MKNAKLKKRLGQNTAEYILMLVLVAGAAIVAFKAFGGTIMDRFNVVMANMRGEANANAVATAIAKDKISGWDINAANTVGSPTGAGAAGGSAPGAGGTPPHP